MKNATAWMKWLGAAAIGLTSLAGCGGGKTDDAAPSTDNITAGKSAAKGAPGATGLPADAPDMTNEAPKPDAKGVP